MRIVELREATAPIASAIRNAAIDFSAMTISVVAVVTDAARGGRPVIGYGFCSNGRYAQGGILRERLFPRVMAAEPGALLDEAGGNLDPFRVWAAAMSNEKPGGHGDRAVAMAALDMAVWDAVAKAEGVPLWRLLAERFNGGRHDGSTLVYPGGGYYYPGKELEQLKEEMRGYRERGYRVVKMKIGGAPLADDLRRIEAVLEVLGGDGSALAVDANGRLDLEAALAYARALEPYGLFFYEEPGDPLDYELNAEVCRAYQGGVATGENLFSHQDVRNLVRYGGMRPERDWIEPDPALAYGLTEFLRIIDVIEAAGWSRRRVIPHGGHQIGLHAALGLRLGGTETYPLVFQPFGGFADDAVIEDGHARAPDAPGLGIERKVAMFAEFKRLLGT
ncbi:MAG TPA: enolase C-terminal domain-like protein [Geminicoccaceae bacterium]|nr:enolase C-terminal domain-like protein [Geminicoccaceae bacterium]